MLWIYMTLGLFYASPVVLFVIWVGNEMAHIDEDKKRRCYVHWAYWCRCSNDYRIGPQE